MIKSETEIVIPIDMPTCKHYNIPTSAYKDALNKEFNIAGYKLTLTIKNESSTGLSPVGIGVLKVTNGNMDEIHKKIENIFRELVKEYEVHK